MTDTSGRGRAQEWARRVAASLAAVAAAAGLVAFSHLGAFDDSNDPFPHSVVVHPG
ncbi:hypothetical protein [Blastococcus sp. CT_GayMR19]|uniref:hypothetical protein n=1 Tax=Blastococcus sp. CT_GayMR19 TaxID=2559608 RepID=UPI001431A1CC|nr:hypothetical protein [Blastococcus sp. CT_GayMR19]